MVHENSMNVFKDSSLIISPQLGHPNIHAFISEEISKKMSFLTELWFLAGKNNTFQTFSEEIKGNFNLIPLLGHNPETKKVVRGSIIPLEIVKIKERKIKELKDITILSEFLESKDSYPDDHIGSETLHRVLIENEIFQNRNYCYQCIAKFQLTNEAKKYLELHQFLMFDLVQNFSFDSTVKRFLYHSIAISKSAPWTDFNFIHISDLHISRRNDYFLGMIKENMKSSVIKYTINTVEKMFLPKKENNRIGSWSRHKIRDIPLEDRIQNPNNQFRKLISKANLLALENKVDFIVISGDIVDYCTSAEKYLSSTPEYHNFINIEDTNWERFLDIVLARDIFPLKGFNLENIEPSEELLVPIFTCPGNHDWRVSHYGIQSLGIFKKLGLTRLEAMNYREPIATNPLSTNMKSLFPYLQHINPFLNYFLKFGEHTFIFLDSGPEAVEEIKYMLMADPNTSGFSDAQIDYVLTILKELNVSTNENGDLKHTGYTFLVSHAPIVNPSKKEAIKIKFLQAVKLLPEFNLEDYKVSRLQEIGVKDPRSDKELEYRTGTISKNWARIIGILNRYRMFHLAGHTHKWREFYLKRSNSPSISKTGYGKKIINPFAIYWGNFSEHYGNSDLEFFNHHLPFLLQVPSLGIANEKEHLNSGGYRLIKIKNNKLKEISMNFI